MSVGKLTTGAGVVAVAALVGVGAFALTSDDAPPPPTTTTTTTAPPTDAELAGAVAAALAQGLDVELDASESACVARGIVEELGRERLLQMADPSQPAVTLTDPQKGELVRTLVVCLPEFKARGLLSPTTSTTVPASLPDEGAGG